MDPILSPLSPALHVDSLSAEPSGHDLERTQVIFILCETQTSSQSMHLEGT